MQHISKMKLTRIPSTSVSSLACNTVEHNDPTYPPRPSTTPTNLLRWLPFLHTKTDYRVLNFSAHELRTIKAINNASISTLSIGAAGWDDIADLKLQPRIQSAIDELGGSVFVRWDESSPKDGVHGLHPLNSARMVLEQICTAARTQAALEASEKTWLENKTEGKGRVEAWNCPLIMLRWNEAMDVAKEFRCFCWEGRLTAVSQYEWHRFSHDWSTASPRIWFLAKTALIHILAYNSALNNAHRSTLLRQGFVFDILVKGDKLPEEAEEAQIVALNAFGPNSNCGSALFNWVRDYEVLVGRTGEREMRILREGAAE